MEFITTNSKKNIKITPATFREQLELKNEFWNVLKQNPEITETSTLHYVKKQIR